MSSDSPAEVQLPVVVSSKKQRSARSTARNGWGPAQPETRRLVGCSYSSITFSPNTYVWARRVCGAWWPAKVVGVDENPEDLKKQEEGCTYAPYYYVQYNGVDSAEAFAWLKSDELFSYESHAEEYSKQQLPDGIKADELRSAMAEAEAAAGNCLTDTTMTKLKSFTRKSSEIRSRFTPRNERETPNEEGGAPFEDTEQVPKRRKLKIKGVDKVRMTESASQLQSKGKEICKDTNILDKSEDLTRKRKRMIKKQVTGASEHESSKVETVGSPTKRNGSPTVNPSNSTVRVPSKKSGPRGKKTGDDGYYFECSVCDLGGDLLCCEFCPRVYHLECLSPPLKRTPPGQWSCPFCREMPGVTKGIVHTQDSKPRIKSTTQVGESSAHVTGQKLKGQKRWKIFHKGKIAQDLDIKTLKKRKRDEDTEKPGKRVNLKLSKPFIPSQVKCKQCGAGIHSSGESPSALFCRDCVELRKLNDVTVSPTKMSVPAKKEMVPTRHSKLKAGKCDVCQEDGYVILCDSCPRGYHKECLNPPRKRAPKGAWACPKCGPLKDVREPKETREAREARAGSKAAKAVKAVKPVKEKEAKVEVRQERPERPELVVPSPTTLEVERILGCRVTQGSDASRRKCKESDVNGKSEPVTEAENGQMAEGKSGERHNIEIRIPICKSEGAGGERGIQEKDKSRLQVAEPKTAAGAQGSCSNDKGRVGVSAEANGGRVAAELSTAGILDNDLEKVISHEASSAAEEGSPERKDVRLGAAAANKCSSHTQVRLECSLVEAKGEEEEGKPSAGQLSAEKSGGESEQTHVISKDNNSSGESKGLERALRVKEGVGKAETMSLSLEAACSSKSSSGMDMLAAAELRTERVDPDYPGTESARKPESPSAHLQSTEKPDPCEFLVKWVGKSHIHNEWISEERLRQIAKRKLDNYKGKYGSVPKVLMQDLWLRPQRVLAKRASKKNGDEVFVKWCGLSYEDCTWELASEPALEGIEELVHAHEMFERAAQDNCSTSVSKDSNDANSLSLRTQRPSQVETLAEQPTYLKGGSLFPHQLEALNWLRKCWHRQRNVILADEMGLGKTISATSFLAAVHHEFQARAPCLVLVPLSTMPNWLAEFSQWAPSLNVIEYHGSAKARNIIREHEWHPIASDGSKLRQAYKFNVMLTTYEMVIQDSTVLKPVPWEVLVVDEGHRLKNSESKLFTILNTFSFSHRVLLTGTPLQNNFAEMFNLLNFLQPDKFPSLAAWEEKFSGLSTAEQVEELKKLVAPNMLRRLKKDAMQKIPPKIEIVVPVDMNSVQSEYYKALLTRNYLLLRNGAKQQSMLNIVMQLRKVCNHPYLIAGTEPETGTPEFLQEMRIKASSKLMLLHSMLAKLKADGHRVLVFSQMTKLLDILEDYLTSQFGSGTFERVDGSVSVAERQAAIMRFNHDTSRFVFLLSTRACGLGINLATADTVIIYDSDFNPQADIQAMNRAHRIGQSKTLLVYRLVTRSSVEERILHLAKKKLMLDHLFANKSSSQKDVEDIIRWGTEELFQEPATQGDETASVIDLRVSGDAEVADDMEAKPKKKTGWLADIYGSYYEKLGRSKHEWDDAAVTRLLDRSELNTRHVESSDGEHESDLLGSLKAWDWNDPEFVPEEHEKEDSNGKEVDVEAKRHTLDEDNQWDKLLKSRWETMQAEEEAALGRGKRLRKAVSYHERNGEKPKEPSSESSDEDDPEHEYMPEIRSNKLKMQRLRARQKDRIQQRYIRSAGIGEGERLVTVTGMPTDGMGVIKKLDVVPEGPATPWPQQPLPFLNIASDQFSQALCKGSATSVISPTVPEISSVRNSAHSTVPHVNIDWYSSIKKPFLQQHQQVTGTSNDEAPLGSKTRQKGHPSWLVGLGSEPGSNSVMTQIFGKPAAFGDESRTENASGVPFPQKSSGSHSSQLPDFRQNNLPGVLDKKSSRHSPPLQRDSRGSTPGSLDGPAQPETGIDSLGGLRSAKTPFSVDELKSFAGPHFKSKPPDVALEFSQKIFGAEKGQSSGVTSTGGEALSGLGIKQGPLPLSSLLPLDSSSLKNQTSENTSALPGSSLQPVTESRSPSLSMALGLGGFASTNHDRSKEASPAADARNFLEMDVQAPVLPSSSASLRSRAGVDLHDLNNLGRVESMPIELDDDNDHQPAVNARGFLSPAKVDGAGRGWQFEEKRKLKQDTDRSWTEDELDALWIGVRRHGRGNWAAMLLDSKLCFSKSRSVGELAERWKADEINKLGRPEDVSENAKQPAHRWADTTKASSVEGVEGSDHFLQRLIGSDRCTGQESSLPLPSFGSDMASSRVHDRREKGSWNLPDLKPLHERLPPLGSTSAGLDLVNKIGELGGSRQQTVNYQNLLDPTQRSSPSLQPGLPSRTTLLPSSSLGVNLAAPFVASSSQALSRLESGGILKPGGHMDLIAGDSVHSLSPGLALSSEWRKSDSRSKERGYMQQHPATISGVESLKHHSFQSQSSTILNSSDSFPSALFPAAPNHVSSAPGHNLGSRALVSLPYNGGLASDHRRRSKPAPAPAKDESGPSSLPHWLREVVKPKPAPQQPPLPPAIAAVVQATSLLYKDHPRLLPPLVHPGYPLVPPRELPKRAERRRRRRKTNHLLPAPNHNHSAVDYTRSVKMEGLSQSLLPPAADGISSLLARSLPTPGQANSLGRTKVVDVPPISSFDPSQQVVPPPAAGSISEIMARRSLMELGFMSGHSDPVLTTTLNSSRNPSIEEADLGSLGQSKRPAFEFRPAEAELPWKRTDMQSASIAANVPSTSRHLNRISHGGASFPESFPQSVGRVGEGKHPASEKNSVFPPWLLSENPETKAESRQRLRQGKDNRDGSDGSDSSSSKTDTDPEIRDKMGKDAENEDDASSEETISDEGTQ